MIRKIIFVPAALLLLAIIFPIALIAQLEISIIGSNYLARAFEFLANAFDNLQEWGDES